MVQLRNCDSDPIAGLHPLHHTGQHFVASKSARRMAHDFHQSTDPGCINSMAQARGTPRGRRGLSQCGNDRVRHVVMTDSRDGLPPLPVSDLSSSLHCIEPLLLPHPRFYQECWRQKGRQCHGCRLSSQPVTTSPRPSSSPEHSAASCTPLPGIKSSQTRRSSRAGWTPHSPIPQNHSLSWKWAGVAARRLPIGLCNVNTLTELSS